MSVDKLRSAWARGRLPPRELPRLALVLFVRGFLLLALAGVAVRWPEETLLDAMVIAGAVIAFLGVFELTLATLSSADSGAKALMLLHALLGIAFGGITVAARLSAVCTTTAFASTWLLLQAALGLAMIPAATAPWGRPALFAWSAFNVACAFVAATYTCAAATWLLYLGAVYSAGYGVAQVAAALWIRRHVRELARTPPRTLTGAA